MPTQTGSIDLKATGGFKTYADAQFATSEQVTTLNTAIEQNARDITFRATKEEAAQMAQPNLSPYFSAAKADVYNATTNPTGYWSRIATNSQFSTYVMEQTHNGSGGWAHFAGNATSNNPFVRFEPFVMALKPSTTYTFLVEWDGTFSNTGNVNLALCSGTSQGDAKDPFATPKNVLLKGTGAATSPQYVTVSTRADMSAATVLGRSYLQVYGTGAFDCYVRISLYEGEYAGPYKPYSGDKLYASQAELKVTNDSVSSKVSTTDYNGQTIASLINQSADSVVIEAEHIELNGTTVFNTIKSSLDSNYDAKGSAATVQQNLDNLEVGGRNLARNTADFSGWGRDNTVWTFSDGVATFTPPSTRSWKQLGQKPGAPLSLFDFDATYVISFDAMLVSGTVASGDSLSPCVALRDTADTNSRQRYRSWNIISSLTSEWQRITKVIDPLPISSWSGTASSEAYFGVDFWLYTATATIAIRNVKLEKGNKATDWSPAPEDVTYDINAVSTAMSEANEGLADSIAGVSKSLEEANTRITNLTKAVEDADADRAKWVQVDSENGITIGAVDSSYNLVLDNNSVDFMVGDQLAATASIEAFIPTALRLGDYVLSGSGGYLYIDYQPLT